MASSIGRAKISPLSADEFYADLLEAARLEGFPLAGGVDLNLALADAEGRFQDHLEKYDEWLARGYAGAMQYLVRGRDRRSDPRIVFPEVKSIFCVALPYDARPVGASQGSAGPRYARYLRGEDYHVDIANRLERAMTRVQTPELRWKVCVDTSAVLERSWAALAGLGWIGKNKMLIHPQLGSYLLLGEVLINREVNRGPSPMSNYCGHCTRCLEGCPTSAFTQSGQLDSNRCVSYWTLEKRGDLALSAPDRKAVGAWVAGCDICQEVCPFNFKATKNSLGVAEAGRDPCLLDSWAPLLAETEADYRERVRKSALNRVKPADFKRNLLIAHSNSIERDR